MNSPTDDSDDGDVYYRVTGWHKADDGSMTHTETWTCDNEPSMNEKKAELLAAAVAHLDEGEGPSRRAFAVRFERVTQKGDDQDFDFLDEFWFDKPLPEWHQ